MWPRANHEIRGQRPTATEDPYTKPQHRRPSRHCSRGRRPRLPHLAPRPHRSNAKSETVSETSFVPVRASSFRPPITQEPPALPDVHFGHGRRRSAALKSAVFSPETGRHARYSVTPKTAKNDGFARFVTNSAGFVTSHLRDATNAPLPALIRTCHEPDTHVRLHSRSQTKKHIH